MKVFKFFTFPQTLLLIILLLTAYTYFPRPMNTLLDPVFEDTDEIIIVYRETIFTDLEDDFSLDTIHQQFKVYPQTPEFNRLHSLLTPYPYHLSPEYLLSGNTSLYSDSPWSIDIYFFDIDTKSTGNLTLLGSPSFYFSGFQPSDGGVYQMGATTAPHMEDIRHNLLEYLSQVGPTLRID